MGSTGSWELNGPWQPQLQSITQNILEQAFTLRNIIHIFSLISTSVMENFEFENL